MTSTNAIYLLTEILHSEEADALLPSADWSIQAGEEARERIAWIESLIQDAAPNDSVDDILFEIEEVIKSMNDAVNDLRGFVSRAHNALGHVDAAREAIEAFCSNPTEENRLKLAKAATPLAYSSVAMSASEKGKLRKFVEAPIWRGLISFGSLALIAETALDPSKIIEAEAA
ncbi:hypothetical protein H9Q09_04965 [Aurantimonas sp. DM33-3]|uniref:hypothetical protein n=1 Tax=Aurantimonas sp. DM33-3 TaxID=2766955 RepID=UPI001651DF74|nr:hypothetical protein [Aurantimonas sp. DM33-3]MBC6715543.1 hypothetical protein [Aurantimonas sp. DM33-3]